MCSSDLFGEGPAVMPSGPEIMGIARVLVERVTAAMEAGITPDDAEAAPIVDGLVGPWAKAVGRIDGPAYRRDLIDALELSHEPRAERYWQLLAIINGWPPVPTTAHRWAWLAAALRSGLP